MDKDQKMGLTIGAVILAVIVVLAILYGSGKNSVKKQTYGQSHKVSLPEMVQLGKDSILTDVPDTVFLGIYLGMPEKEVKARLRALSKERRIAYKWGHYYYPMAFDRGDKDFIIRPVYWDHRLLSLHLSYYDGEGITQITQRDLYSKFHGLFVKRGFKYFEKRDKSDLFETDFWIKNNTLIAILRENLNTTLIYKNLLLEGEKERAEKREKQKREEKQKAKAQESMSDF